MTQRLGRWATSDRRQVEAQGRSFQTRMTPKSPKTAAQWRRRFSLPCCCRRLTHRGYSQKSDDEECHDPKPTHQQIARVEAIHRLWLVQTRLLPSELPLSPAADIPESRKPQLCASVSHRPLVRQPESKVPRDGPSICPGSTAVDCALSCTPCAGSFCRVANRLPPWHQEAASTLVSPRFGSVSPASCAISYRSRLSSISMTCNSQRSRPTHSMCSPVSSNPTRR